MFDANLAALMLRIENEIWFRIWTWTLLYLEHFMSCLSHCYVLVAVLPPAFKPYSWFITGYYLLSFTTSEKKRQILYEHYFCVKYSYWLLFGLLRRQIRLLSGAHFSIFVNGPRAYDSAEIKSVLDVFLLIVQCSRSHEVNADSFLEFTWSFWTNNEHSLRVCEYNLA